MSLFNCIASLLEPDPPKRKVQQGDVIYVKRKGGLYHHFGVYIGNNEVIHFTDLPSSSNHSKACIRKTSMKEFLNGDKDWYISVFKNQHKAPLEYRGSMDFRSTRYDNILLKSFLKELCSSGDYKLYSPEETITRAKSQLGKEGYNLIVNNCEHFAVWCKTGVHESHQVNKIIDEICDTDNSLPGLGPVY